MAILVRCSNPNPTPDPKPGPVMPKDNIITLELNSNSVTTFYSVNKNEANKTELDTVHIKSYFGNRVKTFIPSKIVIDNDSLKITKPFDVTEKYEITWRENSLFYRSSHTSQWKTFGLTRNNKLYTLHTEYYLIKSNNDNVKATTIGQNYADVPNLNEVMEEGDVCIILKINSTFYDAD